MNKDYIKKMLDGVEDQYIEEAAADVKAVSKSSKKHYRKIAVAAAIGLVVAGTGVSVIAAKNPNLQNVIAAKSSVLQNLIQPFSAKDVETEIGSGVYFTKEEQYPGDTSAQTNEKKEEGEMLPEESKDSKPYYLVLNYLPKGYHYGDETSGTYIYYGEKGDTDFFTLYYYHLQTDFTNILPDADAISKYEAEAGTAYIASSKEDNRAWILFHEGSYMMELRDVNKVLSKKEIKKIMDGAELSAKKPSVIYETLEWTKKLQKACEQELESALELKEKLKSNQSKE